MGALPRIHRCRENSSLPPPPPPRRHIRRVALRPLLLVELHRENVGFCGGRKTGEPRERASEKKEREQTKRSLDGNLHKLLLN